MKKIFAGISAGVLAAALSCASAFAYPPVTVIVDGQTLSFDQPPVIQNDRVLVPMRAIFQALGAAVYWDEPAQTVTAQTAADSLQFRIGDTGLYKNGALAYSMSVPAQIINERMLVPIRAVSESFGATVGWDEPSYTVTIQSNGQAVQPTQTTNTPTQNGSDVQSEPKAGGFSAEVCAEDGTAVLTVTLECDIVEKGSAAERINTALAELTFAEGQGFLREYSDAALRAYAANPSDFRPYYIVGSWHLTQADGYASFLASVISNTGTAEQTAYSSHIYSLSSGKETALTELVDDSQTELESLWRAGFQALIDEKPAAFYSDAGTKLERSLASVGFYLTEDGIVFYLPPESIAPADAGLVAFEVEYDF